MPTGCVRHLVTSAEITVGSMSILSLIGLSDYENHSRLWPRGWLCTRFVCQQQSPCLRIPPKFRQHPSLRVWPLAIISLPMELFTLTTVMRSWLCRFKDMTISSVKMAFRQNDLFGNEPNLCVRFRRRWKISDRNHLCPIVHREWTH